MVRMKRMESNPVTVTVSKGAETFPDAEAVDLLSFRASLGSDQFPPEAAIPVDLIPRHLHKLLQGREHRPLLVLLEVKKMPLECWAIEIEPNAPFFLAHVRVSPQAP